MNKFTIHLKTYFLILLVLLFIVSSGQERGIHFENGICLEQKKNKTAAENKYIFVDFYTTWCGPCKAMERDVYSEDSVGNIINSQFISVKVQMDQKNTDNDNIKAWYSDARQFEKEYQILAYPSYMFFSPDGKPVQKAVGYKSKNDFIEIALSSEDKRFQYYTILKDFRPGYFDTSYLKRLSRLMSFDKALSGKLALDYLSRIPVSQLMSDENKRYIDGYTKDTAVANFMIDYFSKIGLKNFEKLSDIQYFGEEFGNWPRAFELGVKYIEQLSRNDIMKWGNLDFLTRPPSRF